MKSSEPNTNITSEGFKLNRLYLTLWHAGFRWLYLIDAIVMFTIMVLVNLIRFGAEWPEKTEMWIGIVAATLIFQIVFYFGGLYEKQVRLGQRMWFSHVSVTVSYTHLTLPTICSV